MMLELRRDPDNLRRAEVTTTKNRNDAMEVLEKMIAAGATQTEIMEWKAAAFRRVQNEGDVHMGLFPTGQVASGISSVVRIADLVPQMVQDATRIFERLSRGSAM